MRPNSVAVLAVSGVRTFGCGGPRGGVGVRRMGHGSGYKGFCKFPNRVAPLGLSAVVIKPLRRIVVRRNLFEGWCGSDVRGSHRPIYCSVGGLSDRRLRGGAVVRG